MPEIRLHYPIPANEDDLDCLACRLMSRHWSIPDLTRQGRRGQGQHGVDFYGQTAQGKTHGGQSKLRVPPAALTAAEARAEINAAKAFRPALSRYAIVTSGRRDAQLQKVEREINEEHRKAGLFSVKIFFWDDVLDLFAAYPDVRDAFYGGCSSSQIAEIKSLIGNLAQQRAPGICDDGRSHAEIDEAVQSLRKGDWRSARTLLERMRQRQWHTYGPLEKFRVLANLGHTYEHEGDFDGAAKYFLEASSELPDDERAKVRAICAHTYLGDFDLAHRLAVELKAAHPENADGFALWIRTSAEDAPFTELEQSVPVHLRNESSIAFELSRRALLARRFDDAEQYARAGFAKEPDDPLVLAQLGLTLVVREVSENFIDARLVPTPKTNERLLEAIDLLTRAIDSPKNEANAAVRADLLLKRSIAHDLLNDQPQRQADIIQAYRLEPRDVDACVKYAVLLDEQSNSNEAIRILESASSDDPAKLPSLLLAQLLASRNAANDRERALEIVEQSVDRISATPEQFAHIVEFYVRLSISAGQTQRAEQFLNNVRSRIGSTLHHVLVGRIRFAVNDGAAAKASAVAAASTLQSGTPRFDRLQLGWLFHSLQEHQQVVDILRETVKPNAITDDAIRLLDSAHKCDEIEFALQFCAGLRGAGIFDRQCVDLEIGLLFQSQCLQTAIAVASELVATVSDDEFRRELIVRRSILGIETDNPSLIETDPSQLPPVNKVNAALGRMTVILIHRAQPLRAIDYAYELVRRHFNHPEARMAMIAAFGFGSGAEERIDLPTYESVQPGTAIRFQEHGSEKIDWRIIEDSPDPKTEYDELSPDHELAQEMMSKRVGDDFYLRKNSVQDRMATIQEIVPKYVYRLRECLDSWEERFPGECFVQQIQVKQSPDGQPDLSPIFNSVDRRIQQTQTIDSLYRDNPISMYSVAKAQGESIVSVITHIAGQKDLEVKCCLLSEADVQTLQKLPLAQRIVLDPSALATLFLTDTFDKVIVPNGLWAIGEATHREIRHWRDAVRESKKDGGFITKIDGRHVLLPNDAWDHARIIERFERFEAIVEDRMLIEPGDEILRCGKTLRQQLVGVFGLACAQSIATAMRPGHLLWTDDLVAGIVAADPAKCNRVWTQGVAGWLTETGQMKPDSYDDLSLRLIEANYTYTLISPSIVLLAAKKSNWNPDDLSLNKCLAWFSNRATRPEPMFQVFVGTIKAIWTEVAVLQTAEPITLRLLEQVGQLSYGRSMIRELYKNSRLLFGLNVVAAEALDEVIQAWAASGGGQSRIILPRS